MINSDLEIFRTNKYYPSEIGLVSDNAYLSIVVTNNCQLNCPYCINSMTDRKLHLPLDKAINNINKLIQKYPVKTCVILGGEPLLYEHLFELIQKLPIERKYLTTNGVRLKDPDILDKICKSDLAGLNISVHNEDVLTKSDLQTIYNYIKSHSKIKVRINTNIYKNNHDTLPELINWLEHMYDCCDEFRVSNIIYKDSFSVNDINDDKTKDLILTDDDYANLFNGLIKHFANDYFIFNNQETLGFVNYYMIPTKHPIVINWNIDSHVADQVCENDLTQTKINTFKCLVSGNISLSWNETNIFIK